MKHSPDAPRVPRRVVVASLAGLIGDAVLTACSKVAGSPASTSASAPRVPGTPAASTSATPVAPASPAPSQPSASGRLPADSVPADPLPSGVVNALIFGTDARDGSFGGRSDAIVLGQLSADRRHLTLVSIARDSLVDIPGHGRSKVNAAFAWGGTALLQRTVSQVLGGLPIHLTVQCDFSTFLRLSAAMNGTPVRNRHASSVTSSVTHKVTHFPAGSIVVRAADLLIYARQRHGLPLGDLDRAERQRAVLVGLLTRIRQLTDAAPRTAAGFVTRLASLVKITGPLEVSQAAGLLRPLRTLDLDAVTSLMVPLTGFGSWQGASVDLVHPAQLAELAAALRAGDVSSYVKTHGTGYAPHR